jgi:pimeloyl-ACP methyl ester carboxylesterase
VTLRDDRRLGFAEYGRANGRPVLWFHGTPGGRCQVPVLARRLAVERDVRLIAVERPGVGLSTRHLYGSLLDWADDVEQFTTSLQLDRFAVIGLSGGGPYVLACAARMPTRVVAGAVLGGVAPTRGAHASPGGLVALAVRFAPILTPFREPLARGAWLAVRLLRPIASQAMDLYARISPESDRRVFADPVMKQMFIEDLLLASRRQIHAPVYDLILFTRPWGFSLRDVKVPIDFWHGDSDNIVPLAHGEHLATLVAGSVLKVRPGESHLGGLAAAVEILDTLLAHWDEPRDEPGGDVRPWQGAARDEILEP